MRYSGWDALKDFLGALGPILMAIPWLSDFSVRSSWKQILAVRASGRLAHLKQEIASSLREKFESPKASDFVWTIIGLLPIFFFFLIAVFCGLGVFVGPPG